LDSQTYTLRVDKQVIFCSHWTMAHVIAVCMFCKLAIIL
jgi:hypothetical protein